MNNNTQWLLIKPNTCLCGSSISAITLEEIKVGKFEIRFQGDRVGMIHFHMVNPTDIFHIGDYPWNIAQKIYTGILQSLHSCSGVIDIVGLIKEYME